MSKQLFLIFLILGITIQMTGCGMMQAPANTALPPTAMPPTLIPTTEVPPTSIPPTEVPPTATNTMPATIYPSTGKLPAGCVDALSITDDQIGQTLCVGGIVGSIWNKQEDRHIMFKGAGKYTMFFVCFQPCLNWTSKSANPGDCVYLQNAYITKAIERYLNATFAVKDLKYCS